MDYKVLLPLRHNGKKYKAGANITLEKEFAAPLLEIKAIETVKNPKPPANPVPAEFQEYAQKTNNEQIAYILTLTDAEQLEKLLPYSKSKAKQAATRRIGEIKDKPSEGENN